MRAPSIYIHAAGAGPNDAGSAALAYRLTGEHQMTLKKLLACFTLALVASGVAQAAQPAGTGQGTGAEKGKRVGTSSRAAPEVPVIPDVAARRASAPPPGVVDRLVNVGASPVAVGVLRQLTDDEPLSPR
jgi:hypothetical protein